MPPNLPQNILQPAVLPVVVTVVLGLVVLLFGRMLYWVFVAIAGFLIGMELANQWLADREQWIRILAAVGAGVLGAVLSIIAQRLAFAIGGFFAGGYLALMIAAHFHAGGDPNLWMIFGGVIGAIAAALIMDWAIIVLSSIAGAVCILSPFAQQLDDRVAAAILVALVIVGIVVQGRQLIGRVRTVPPPPV